MNTKTNFRLLILLGVLFTGFTACQGDNNDGQTSTVITKEKIAGQYKITTITVKSGTEPEEDLLAQMDACQRDNVVTFNLNSTYSNSDVGIVCNPPGGDDGIWDLPNSTTFSLDGIGMTIKSFAGGKLDLTYTDNSSTPSDVYHYIFTRQ